MNDAALVQKVWNDAHVLRDQLPPPDEVAAEIVENLGAALERFRRVAASLQSV